jgi:hypothetical protein
MNNNKQKVVMPFVIKLIQMKGVGAGLSTLEMIV